MGRDDSKRGLTLVTGAPQALEAAFLDHVAAIRAGEPLAPIDVLVGGVLQRPYLQRLIAESSPGMLNVRFHTLGELGVRLGEQPLLAAGRRPLPAMPERVLVAQAARAAEGYFAPVAATPGFADATHRLLRELRQEDVTPDALRVQAAGIESPAKAADLADLYERAGTLRTGTYDGLDALVAADPDRFDGHALLIYGIWRLSAAARRLVAAIADRAPVTVFLPTTGADADGAHAELRAWLTARGSVKRAVDSAPGESALAALQCTLFTPNAPIPTDDSVAMVSAPDPPAEVREAARVCLDWAREGIPFRQMAVTYRQAEVYRPLLEAVFAEAGIPVYLDDGPSLAERPLGRRILALIDLIESPLRRRDVIGFLSDGWMPKATRERFGGAKVSQWDSLSRRAGVVAGAEQWRARLNAFRVREQRALDDAPDRDWIAARIEGIDHLVAFVDELAGRFTARPEAATWTASLTYLRELITTYIDGADDVIGYLDSLAALDALLPEVTFARFLEVVRAEMANLKAGDLDEGNQGAFGRRGVNVLDVNQLRHLRFDAVAVLGLTERAFPPPPRQDPLLLDDERRALNAAAGWTLPLRALGPDPEPLQFALAVHAARTRLLLSTRRADEPGGRLQLASSFFRAAVSAMAGERVRIDEVEHRSGIVRRLRAGLVGSHPREGAAAAARAMTLAERDRTFLEADAPLGRAMLDRLEPRAARADVLRRARWQARDLTPFDGAFADPAAVAAIATALDEGRIVSATRLETYAACPFRYFLGSVLRLKPQEEPEDLLRISRMELGNVVHEVLRRFVATLPDGRLDRAAAAAHRDALRAIAAEEFDRAEALGLTGTPLLWAADRAGVEEDLARWLELELADAGGYAEHGVEVAFGGRWSGQDASPLDTDDPLQITAGTRTLALSGRVDRIDYTPGERFRIIDYKTGSGWGLPKDGELRGGTALQLPIYLWAGAMILGIDPTRGEAAYHLVSRRGDFRRIAFSGADLAARAGDLDAVLTRIGEGIAGGDFHHDPPKDACTYCDFDGLCDVGRLRLRDRKATDARAESFADMRRIA